MYVTRDLTKGKNYGVKFKDIKDGDLFDFYDYIDGLVYMRIEEICIENRNYNAICIVDDSIHRFIHIPDNILVNIISELDLKRY